MDLNRCRLFQLQDTDKLASEECSERILLEENQGNLLMLSRFAQIIELAL